MDPESGAELSFTYTPQIEAPSKRVPKYGDLGTTEILTRQWPALFHAATNVTAFIRAFSSFVNLSHLTISCPGYDPAQMYRRSIVDYALISLRIAIERNNLNALENLKLSPIHPGGLLYLLPRPGYGATPRSARRWSRIRHLALHVDALPKAYLDGETDYFKVLQTYLRNFQSNLLTLRFRWNGEKGRIPIHKSVTFASPTTAESPNTHQPRLDATVANIEGRQKPSLYFPKLERAEFENVKAKAKDISNFAESHKRTIVELDLEDVELVDGTWHDALAPLTKLDKARAAAQETAEIPIMLSPTHYPAPMQRVEVAHQENNGRKSLRLSRWLSSKGKVRTPARKVREGLSNVLRGSVLPWR